MNTTRTLDEWFELYSTSHRNKTNKAIHFFAIPSIYLSIMGLLWAIPVPAMMTAVPGLNWATLMAVPVLAFYLPLSLPITIGMLLFTALCFTILTALAAAGVSVLNFSAVLFVVMWILQFYGHAVEGKKPSFFQDLQFLLIGPAWVLGFLLGKVGVRA